MTEKTKSNIFSAFMAILIGGLIVACIGICTSCTVTKSKSKSESDSTVVKKADVVAVSKDESGSKSKNEWWKETQFFSPVPIHDTTTEKLLQPIYHNSTQPVMIIREGGIKQEESYHIDYDSLKSALFDSARAIVKESAKDKKTEVLSTWQILAIIIGLFAAVELIRYVKSKFTIVKRQDNYDKPNSR